MDRWLLRYVKVEWKQLETDIGGGWKAGSMDQVLWIRASNRRLDTYLTQLFRKAIFWGGWVIMKDTRALRLVGDFSQGG